MTPSLLETAFLSIFEAFARLMFSSHSLLMARIWSPTRILPSFRMAPLTDFTRILLDLLSCIRERPAREERERSRANGTQIRTANTSRSVDHPEQAFFSPKNFSLCSLLPSSSPKLELVLGMCISLGSLSSSLL